LALEDGPRVLERDARGFEVRTRLVALGERLRERGTLVRVLEARDDLAFLDASTFFDRELDDAAGELRRDGGLPTRDDVAGRVENRAGPVACRRVADGRFRRGDADDRCGFRFEHGPGGRTGGGEQRNADAERPPFPSAPAG